MIEFWLCAGLLILTALFFMLVPLIRKQKKEHTSANRTKLNVSLYKERISEFETRHAEGALSDSEFQFACDEVGRELLIDADNIKNTSNSEGMGRIMLVVIILCVPIASVTLYLKWGALDQVKETEKFFIQPTQQANKMTSRLEEAVKANPDSANGWYLLGRAYMVENRTAEAAKAFEKTVELKKRDPEVLGQWAQSLFFSANKKWSDQMQNLVDEALKKDPKEKTSLGLLGVVAFQNQKFRQAIDYWQRLVVVLPDDDVSRQAIEQGIQQAQQKLAKSDPKAVNSNGIIVEVSLDQSIVSKVKNTDSVFIFARASDGPPMPLAVKRLTVADLPVTVTLSDKDAMMPQMKISNFKQVVVGARISSTGNASKGEWIGLSKAVSSSLKDPYKLVINKSDN
ncbi:UNVERIFIED_CONTAM: hypothetical protein GTU68_036255 [Idotea baltica]|nr:hypothetical protein [Idotea baltica]